MMNRLSFIFTVIMTLPLCTLNYGKVLQAHIATGKEISLLKTQSGAIEHELSPKVVINRNDPLFTGTDTGLQVQTIVHETGHGVMSQLYGYDSLPETDWLGKAHAGGTVSDEQLAMIEGWAEFTGAFFTGDYTIANDPDNALADNRYAYKDIYTRTEVRTASEMKKTEGWVCFHPFETCANQCDNTSGTEPGYG